MLFNKARAQEYMRHCGVDALVATSPVSITYVSDYTCWLDPLFKAYMMVPGAPSHLPQGYAVFPREGEPALVVNNPLFAVNAADLWIRDLHIFDDPGLDRSSALTPLSDVERRFLDLFDASPRHATPTDALVSLLHRQGLADARVGLEMEGLPPETREAIVRALPKAKVMDCSNLLRLIRMVKTPDELSRLARSAEIAERATLTSLAVARPGRPMADIIQRYRAEVGVSGADVDHFAFGVRGLGIATGSDYVLTSDDVLYVDFGCIYRQCYSDSGMTLAVNELSAPLLEKYRALHECIMAGMDAIRPGVKASVVSAAMWETLTAHGITASFPHGHGLGLEVRDYPIIVADNGLRIRDDCVDVPSDLPIEVDMAINLEASIFTPCVGSLHIEQSFVVTPAGNRPLVEQDRTQPVRPMM